METNVAKSHSDNDDMHIVNTSHDPHPLFQENRILSSDRGLYTEDILGNNLNISFQGMDYANQHKAKLCFLQITLGVSFIKIDISVKAHRHRPDYK